MPVVPGYTGEDQSPDLLQREADAIGYPPDDQGRARWRWQGHAYRACLRAEFLAHPRKLPARSAQRLRPRPRAAGTLHRASAPHRDPGVRRCAWRRDPSQRARVLGAAPLSEGAGGIAFHLPHAGTARTRWAPPRCRPAHAIDYAERRHGGVHRRCRMAGSTSWKSTRACRSSIRSPRICHRAGPGRMAVAHRCWRNACRWRRNEIATTRPRHRSAAVRGRSGCRLPARLRHVADACVCPRASRTRTHRFRRGRRRHRDDLLRPDDRQADRLGRGSPARASPASARRWPQCDDRAGPKSNIAFLERLVRPSRRGRRRPSTPATLDRHLEEFLSKPADHCPGNALARWPLRPSRLLAAGSAHPRHDAAASSSDPGLAVVDRGRLAAGPRSADADWLAFADGEQRRIDPGRAWPAMASTASNATADGACDLRGARLTGTASSTLRIDGAMPAGQCPTRMPTMCTCSGSGSVQPADVHDGELHAGASCECPCTSRTSEQRQRRQANTASCAPMPGRDGGGARSRSGDARSSAGQERGAGDRGDEDGAGAQGALRDGVLAGSARRRLANSSRAMRPCWLTLEQ